MIAHPEMVSGERRSDLALMQAGRGDWVTKIGAEGVQAIGVRSRGLGHRDQGRRRHSSAACIRRSSPCSTQLGAARRRGRGRLSRRWRRPALRNYRGIVTGDVRPVVVLGHNDRR